MRILVTGANGFVGSALCAEAVRAGHDVFALVRAKSETNLLPDKATILRGEFHNMGDAALALATSNAEVVIHAAAVVSTGRPDLEKSHAVNVEGTRALAGAALQHGVRRWLQVSSMSAHSQNCSIYGGTKLACDCVVKASGLPYVIFRPSLVYGPAPRGIFHRLVRICVRAPVIPIVGNGGEPVRPIHVNDLAAVMIRALDAPNTLSKTYQLGGADSFTFRGMVELICTELNRSPLIVPIPRPVCRVMALVAESILQNPPLTTDNIEGLLRAQPVDTSDAERDLAFTPRKFCEGLRECIAAGLLK